MPRLPFSKKTVYVMTREEMSELAAANVATWPPLTPEKRDRLWVLLAPMRAHITAHLNAEPQRLGRAS